MWEANHAEQDANDDYDEYGEDVGDEELAGEEQKDEDEQYDEMEGVWMQRLLMTNDTVMTAIAFDAFEERVWLGSEQVVPGCDDTCGSFSQACLCSGPSHCSIHARQFQARVCCCARFVCLAAAPMSSVRVNGIL